MINLFDDKVSHFVALCAVNKVRMLMVGGGAVNFYGYQRQSADVAFWIDFSNDNLSRLLQVLNQLGYEIEYFPQEVLDQKQNISLKFSPVIDIELITKFSCYINFENAYKLGSDAEISYQNRKLIYKVLSLNNLLEFKIRSGRPKDMLDVLELKRINNLK